jgi:hypothetical protein
MTDILFSDTDYLPGTLEELSPQTSSVIGTVVDLNCDYV